MYLSAVHYIKQWIERRRKQNCMALKHKWEEVPNPKIPLLKVVRCKYCHAGYWSGQ